jgi:hypothetical protein
VESKFGIVADGPSRSDGNECKSGEKEGKSGCYEKKITQPLSQTKETLSQLLKMKEGK